MPKKQWTEEERRAFGEKMRAAKAAKDAAQEPQEYGVVQVTNVEDYQEEVITLDVTRDDLISEADLVERIRRMFDDSNMPTFIKVNSKQLLEILDTSSRWDGADYASPFGNITVQVVPAKELS